MSQEEDAREAKKDLWQDYEGEGREASAETGDEEDGLDIATETGDEGECRGPPPRPAMRKRTGTMPPRTVKRPPTTRKVIAAATPRRLRRRGRRGG
jgi:hypothetical protein